MSDPETGQSSAPLVSIVLCSRNDTYAERMLERQQLALNVLAEQMCSLPFLAELIVVDWNSPADKPDLEDALHWPSFGEKTTVKIISVPGQFQAAYKDSELQPFNAAAAWNVGIRRARGKFILPKAADTIYSNPLFQWLAKGNMNDHSMYRCDRYDVAPSVLDLESRKAHDVLASCESNIVERHVRLPVHPGYGIPDLHTNGAGDFILMARSFWHEIRGFEEAESSVVLDIDGLAMHAAYSAGVKENVLSDSFKIFKIRHQSQFSKRTGRSYRSPWILIDLMMKTLGLPYNWRIDLRIRFDFPRRKIQGYNGVTFPSYARNFIEPSRKWAMEKPPHYLNGPEWGHANNEFKTTVICVPKQVKQS